jgi:transcription elongation factor Elf1
MKEVGISSTEFQCEFCREIKPDAYARTYVSKTSTLTVVTCERCHQRLISSGARVPACAVVLSQHPNQTIVR